MNIVAACVYIVCRQQNYPIMLIDISDKLAVNVYILGKVHPVQQYVLLLLLLLFNHTQHIVRTYDSRQSSLWSAEQGDQMKKTS